MVLLLQVCLKLELLNMPSCTLSFLGRRDEHLQKTIWQASSGGRALFWFKSVSKVKFQAVGFYGFCGCLWSKSPPESPENLHVMGVIHCVWLGAGWRLV